MAEINWGLGQGNSALTAFQNGLQIGDMIRQKRADSALSAYVADTSGRPAGIVATPEQEAESERIRQTLMKRNPKAFMQIEAQNAQREQAEQSQRRADLPMLTNLLRGSIDQATYNRNLATAQQYGIDTSTIPQQFDPAWRDQQLTALEALQTPGGQEALSTAGKIATDEGLRPGTPQFAQRVTQIWNAENQKTIPYAPGGGVAQYDPATGQVRTLIAPNTGGAPTGAPVQQGNIPRLTDPSEVSNLKPGQQFYDPNGVLRQVPGGPTQGASGGFR